MPKKVLTKWEIAKPILEELYLAGDIQDDWPRKKVHSARPEFEAVPINNFGNNWNRMKKSIGTLKQQAKRDFEILQADKLLYPIDENRWDGSLKCRVECAGVHDEFMQVENEEKLHAILKMACRWALMHKNKQDKNREDIRQNKKNW